MSEEGNWVCKVVWTVCTPRIVRTNHLDHQRLNPIFAVSLDTQNEDMSTHGSRQQEKYTAHQRKPDRHAIADLPPQNRDALREVYVVCPYNALRHKRWCADIGTLLTAK